MSWRVVVRPEAGDDISEAASWYDTRSEGLGDEFVEEVLRANDEPASALLERIRLKRAVA